MCKLGDIIVVNKWDTVENANTKEYEKIVRSEFQFLSYVPIVFLSAKTKKRMHTLMPEIINAYENNRKEVKTSLLVRNKINTSYKRLVNSTERL